ncbi:MAG TPA: DsrE family protein [Rubrobacteraceae bacterium]|nr:DsrE family protein [Rubrobacteraceae bacterium]
MERVAVVVLAGRETRADEARVANALTTVNEFKEAGDEVTLIFSGAGTRWIGELSGSDHPLSNAFGMVKDKVAGACSACAASFGVEEEVQASGIPLVEEYKGHPSLKRLVSEGYRVITF